MVKRISIFLFVTLICLSGFFGKANADGYPDYLWGNKNFIICGAHMGYAQYVDKSSLVVREYRPPVYRLSIVVLGVQDADRGNVTPSDKSVQSYYYNWDERKMYYENQNGELTYIYPVGTMARTGHYFAGEMAFYIAYKMKFYGGRKWYDEDFKQMSSPNWSDELYRLVDNAR